MKTIKHTNGKWMTNEGQIYPEETGKTLALIPYYDKEDKEQEANAQLIAAAPELLAALIWANKIIDRLADDYSTIANKHANYTKGESNRIPDALNQAIGS